jgi:signal transduction histidine kinase
MNALSDFLARNIVAVYFLYGLAFFTMGVAVLLESGRSSELRLVRALRPLALFGLLHGAHEWGDMFARIFALTSNYSLSPDELILRHIWLVTSFIMLAIFGMQLLVPEGEAGGRPRRGLVWQVPLGLVLLWLVGLPLLWAVVPARADWLAAIDVWARYVIGIPASLLAAWGLVRQQHAFRAQGLASFGRDSLWAAVAFGWYGLVGQLFVSRSVIFPSMFLNSELFLQLFDVPVQLFRAATAMAAAFFVVRFLRAFEVERARRLRELQAAQLHAVQQREQLRRDLLRQIVTAQEAERQRIARELHDETGQALTGLGLGLRAVKTMLCAENEPAARHVEELEAMAGSALDELRRVVADLRPSHLDDLGLIPALRWYTQEIEARSGVRVRLEAQPPPLPLRPELNTVLFRIVQEALSNVVRHAQAREAMVHLTATPEALYLTVSDDGRGFAPEPVFAPQRGRQAWGLLGMQERAALVGGELTVNSAAGRGTTIGVVVPLDGTRNEYGNGHEPDPPAAG